MLLIEIILENSLKYSIASAKQCIKIVAEIVVN